MESALFNIPGWNLLIAFGLKYVAASRGVILAYTMPMWTVLLSMIFLHERRAAWRAAYCRRGIVVDHRHHCLETLSGRSANDRDD